MIKKTKLLFLFLIITNVLFSQTIKKNSPAEKPIDIIENLGGYIPLDTTFIDENGEKISLESLFSKGVPTILTLNYFECPMLCTLILNGLSDTLENFTLNPGQQYQIITIDINPNETSKFVKEKKKNYIEKYDLQILENDWHFLTGSNENIKRVADSMGFIYYYDQDRDEYMHPSAISILSPSGKISRYLYGIEFLEKDLKLAILEAADGKIGSTLDKIMLYCYYYDPYKNTYTIFATNIMRLGGIFTIIFLSIMILNYWRKDDNLFDGEGENT
tara:strand:- start:6907 stop:7728 length:822 start_codon:yes stop_codon:yes gene_type:complete